MAERSSSRSAAAFARLRDAANHEADVRVTRERGRLEDALHDDGLHLLVDLENDHAGEFLPGARLLPNLTLGLEDVEELVDALKTLAVLDGAGVSGRVAVDEDDALSDSDHRRVDHVERVLG